MSLRTQKKGEVSVREASPKFEAPSDGPYAWLNNAIFTCCPEVRQGYISLQVWKVK